MGIGFGETLPRMSEQLTDQVLVERVQKGDQKAFNLLVVRYQHKVASPVSAMYRRAISLTLFRNRSLRHGVRWTLSGEIALLHWLYRIAVNTAKNYLVAQGAVRRPAMLTPTRRKTSKAAGVERNFEP